MRKHFLKLLMLIVIYLIIYPKLAFTCNISDSITSLLQTASSDSTTLKKHYGSIIKNRRKLKENYLILLHEYLKYSKELKYQHGEMKSLDRIGLQYRYNEQYDSALVYHKQSLKLSTKLKDSSQLYYNYNNLGQVYRMQNLNVQAISFFHKALNITEALGNFKSAAKTMNTLGATHVIQEEYEQAMHYFHTSANIARKLNDKRTLAYNYGSMGEVFLFKQLNDSAMYYFVESKKIIIELGSETGLAVSEHLIGQAHYALSNIKQSELYFHKALEMHKKANNKRYLSLCLTYLGKIKTQQHQYDSAEWYIKTAQKLASDIHSVENLILINNAFFDFYKTTQQWQKAITALKNGQSLKDSIFSVSNAKQIHSIEIAYETDKKEQQIELLSAENKIKNQRIKMATVLIVILFFIALLAMYILRLRKNQSEMANDKLRQQLMLSQMNPHFIFNALGSIQSFMYKNEAKKAAAYLGNFASLTRSILNNSSKDSTTLDDEISTISNYLELEKMRMQSEFEYKIIVPEEIDTELIQIPPMLIQPFIENAIKHGLKNITHKGNISMIFTELSNLISVEITDNGIGINKSLENNLKPSHKSMATDIFKARIKILQKKHIHILSPEIIDITNSKNGITGTKVLLFLPIIE